METAGDNKVEDEPEIVVETERDALAYSAERGNGVALNGIERRIGGAKERRPADLKVFQDVADDALLQRFHVNDDVWKFRHKGPIIFCRFAPNRLQRLEVVRFVGPTSMGS